MARKRIETGVAVASVAVNHGKNFVDRRDQLLQAALKLFSKKGFKGTTTKEIAAQAGISEALVFHHFPTKDDLYAAILEREAQQANTEQWVEEFRGYLDAGEDEKLFEAMISKMIEHDRCNPDFVRLMLYSALERHPLTRLFIEKQTRPLKAFFQEYFIKRQQQGLFNDYDTDAVVNAIIGIPHHHLLVETLFIQHEPEVNRETAIATYVKFILDGLRRK